MKNRYVLIEIHELSDPEMDTAQDLAGYLINELNNHKIIEGNVSGFEDLETLRAYVS